MTDRLDEEGLARGILSPAFPPPMATSREPLPHDRMAPAHRPALAVSPDCEAGKCRPCAGAALDERTDEIIACEHECHAH